MGCSFLEDFVLVLLFISIWYFLIGFNFHLFYVFTVAFEKKPQKLNPLNIFIWYFLDAFNSPNILFPTTPDPAFLIQIYESVCSLLHSAPKWDNLILFILVFKRFRYLFLKLLLLCFINFATFFMLFIVFNLDLVQDYFSSLITSAYSVPFSTEIIQFSAYIQSAVESTPIPTILNELPSIDSIQNSVENITCSLNFSTDLTLFIKNSLYFISDACKQLADSL